MLMNSFLAVSSSVMGLVIFISPIQSFGFGMGYIVPCFQFKGMISVFRISLYIWFSRVRPLDPIFLYAMYGIVEGPGALAFLFCLREVRISSMVISVVLWLYHSGSMFSFGMYCCAQDGNS